MEQNRICTSEKRQPIDWILTIIAIISGLFLLLAAFPENCRTLAPGLDNSWIYVINTAALDGLIFGRDIVFTFGPMGFLAGPVSFGNNMLLNYLYYGMLFFAQIIIVLRCFINKSRVGILLSAVLFTLGIVFLQKEYYTEYIALLLLSFSLLDTGKLKTIECIGVTVLMSFSLFVKFNLSVSLICTIIWIVCLSLFEKRIQVKYYLAMLFATPVLFIFAYLLYNPSVADMMTYIRAAVEISSGYNSAMTLEPEIKWLMLCLFCLVLSISLAIIEFSVDRMLAFQTLMLAPALFFAFKHGFVRADGHKASFFGALLILLSIKLLTFSFYKNKLRIDFSQKRQSACLMAATLILLSSASAYYLDVSPRAYYQSVKSNAISAFDISERAALVDSAEDKLSEDFLRIIAGGGAVAVYPWEQLIDAYNDLNMVYMPVVQAYSVYTPYLDKLNADFFNSTESAPQYIIFNVNTIDGRLPLIECPATWTAIYSNYFARCVDEKYILLERKEAPSPADMLSAYEMKVNINETTSLLQYSQEGKLLLSIDFELTTWGKIVRLFYQIPEVDMEIAYEDGSILAGRIIPENLSNGFLLDSLASTHSLPDCMNMINGTGNIKRIDSIRFMGGGLQFYKERANCTIVISEE